MLHVVESRKPFKAVLKLPATLVPIFARGRDEDVGFLECRSDHGVVEEVLLQHPENREIGDVDRDLEVIGTDRPPSEVVGRTAIAILAATPTVAVAASVELQPRAVPSRAMVF